MAWFRPLFVPSRPLLLGFKFRGSGLRRRSGFTMAELISFVVPTQSDKVLLVWEQEGTGGTVGQEAWPRAEGGAQSTREPAGHP